MENVVAVKRHHECSMWKQAAYLAARLLLPQTDSCSDTELSAESANNC